MDETRRDLVGTCGFYCGSCAVHISYKKGIEYQRKLASALSTHMGKPVAVTEIQCRGCRSLDRDSWGKRCTIRPCAEKKGITYCHECPEFPCDQYITLSETYQGIPFTQLGELKRFGVEKWLETMGGRWRCPKCTGAIESGTKKCGTCNSNCEKHVNSTLPPPG
ncbi:MAG: DUF3795 domain-containing protein [Candidatus Eremiobacteraeota bacterium]|nr:DUF3795 domain-containing protein [Candidatus Eremiobacteraeota bacterium]